ncbi:MAG: phosphotransferase [Desulfobacteraceae bacterium]|nr:phosphotransferase [Desulfobacteraceae bacterium]
MHWKTLSNLSRFKDIAVVLFRYGFDDLLQRLDLPGSTVVEMLGKVDLSLTTAERIRLALEELGPTFVKLGQIMSLRPDLLPSELIEELSKLQDEVPPVPFEAVRSVLEESLQQPIDTVFSVLDPDPLAAASLAQVHRAVLLREGTIVSVKVQRPGIRRKLTMDLDILAVIADRLHEQSEDLQIYDLPRLVQVTRRNLMREVDFRLEARNIRIARSLMDEDDGLCIPNVYDAYGSERVLVTDFIQGTKLRNLRTRKLADPEALAKIGLRAAVKQILEDGFFHADPHPGNMIVTEDERLCLIDWGLIGRLTEKDRFDLVDVLSAIVAKNSEALLASLLRISKPMGAVAHRSLERDLLDVVDSYYAVPLRELNVGSLLMDISTLLREYHLQLPPDFVIMIKALITAEGSARQIYPDLNVISEAEGSVARLAARRYKPGYLWARIKNTVSQLALLQRELPGRIGRIADQIERGELNIHFRHENLGDLINSLENTASRVTLGIIIGAMIIGSSMIITTGAGPQLFGFPALGIIGYFISAVFGLWLVYNILRSKRF